MLSWLPWVRRRRATLRSTPLTDAEHALLAEHAPFVAGLSEEDRSTLVGLVQLFRHDKTFEFLGGLGKDDAIELTVAAHACRLLLGMDVDYPYPGLDVIRVYPSTFRADAVDRLGDVWVEGGVSHRLGESSHRGYVVLSWDAVRRGARHGDDGHNVVLHEFAHQLDTLDGVPDGAPPLPGRMYGPWARILGAAYSELQQDVAARRHNVLDGYGATNPAEFFAVATESFFEEPAALRHQEPQLYDVLSRYYQQDPDPNAG